MSACPEWVARRCVSPRLFALLCGRIKLVVVVVAIISKASTRLWTACNRTSRSRARTTTMTARRPGPEPEPAAAAVLVRRALQGIA